MQCMPFATVADDFVANACSFALLAYFMCCVIFKMGVLAETENVATVLSAEQQHDFAINSVLLTYILMACCFAAIALTLATIMVEIAMEERRKHSEAAKHLPTTEWHLAAGQSYVCFLSHYKVEAGGDARYLKDALDAMLGKPAYLDSSTLADLRELFTSGVHASEVLVLLLSPGILTRPWCLLEIREAMSMGKAIVLVQLTGPGKHFSFEETFEMLSDIEHNMPALNPWCIGELRAHIGDEPLSELQQTVRQALELGLTARQLEFNSNGTVNQIEAALVDLCETLGRATKRELKWTGGRLHESKHWSVVGRLTSRQRFNTSELNHRRQHVCVLYDSAHKSHALRLQKGMQDTLGLQSDVAMPTATDDLLERLANIVNAKFVLLVQTRGVLSQTFALLATYVADLHGVPVCCVTVRGGGYDFDGARDHLEHLDERLNAEAIAQLGHTLSRLQPPQQLSTLQTKLASLIPHMISVVYNPNGSVHELAATVTDVGDKYLLLQEQRSMQLSTKRALSLSRSLLHRTSSRGKRASIGNAQPTAKRRLSMRRREPAAASSWA